jgi:hypothetical protein
MNTTSTILSLATFALLLAAPATAQGFSFTTSGSGYGVVANDGTAAGTVLDSVAPGTTIAPGGIEVGALSGTFASGMRAAARTEIRRDLSPLGLGFEITENGRALGAGARCGTSSDAAGSASPMPGPHGAQAVWSLAPGATGTLSIGWVAQTSNSGALAGAVVDVDGDGTPDFTATAAQSAFQQFALTADANGDVSISVATDGLAGATASSNTSAYHAVLRVHFRPDVPAPTCTFSSFGQGCGGNLAASLDLSRSRPALDFDVSNANANGLGLLLIGTQRATPIVLPNSMCSLLVDATPGLHVPFRTDGAGAASIRLPFTGRRAFTIDAQALLLIADPVAGPSLGTTDGVQVVCQ